MAAVLRTASSVVSMLATPVICAPLVSPSPPVALLEMVWLAFNVPGLLAGDLRCVQHRIALAVLAVARGTCCVLSLASGHVGGSQGLSVSSGWASIHAS